MHELDAQPLAGVRDWLAPYEAEWDRRLERLRRHVDSGFAGEADHTNEEEE
jgi:hypothetical protein